MASKVIEKLAETYQVLYLDPDATEQEEYEKVLLKGQPSPATDLGHFIGDDRDVHDTVDTPAGPVEVITLYNRSDFEVFVRCMMAAKDGPKRQVPKTTGASTLVTFNWDKIRANRDDYKETIIVLSVGPYSNVPAEEVGLEPDEWAEKSYLIRKFHECNHFICRKLFPDQIEAVWDELVADAIGICGAYGYFDPELELKFLGIKDCKYVGGRLENYTEITDELVGKVVEVMEEFDDIIKIYEGLEPFDLIPILEETQGDLWG